MPRIDAHHHLWRYSKEEYGWIGDDLRPLQRDFLLDDLHTVLDEAKVDGTVVVQATQTEEETRWLLELAESDSSILGVVGWLPFAASDFEAKLQKLASAKKLKGLRHVVQAEPEGFLDDAAFNRGISAMRGTGLVYDILIYAPQLPEAIRFVDRHPQQQFVVDHLAKPRIRSGEIERWSADIRKMAQRSNVSCKVSGMVTEADPSQWSPDQLKPYFDVALEAFGPDRLMIGTDWPVLTVGCTYVQWWHLVESWIAPLSSSEKAAILGETAAHLYDLQVEAASKFASEQQ